MTQPGRAEAIIERLHGLYPRLIDLSLERLRRLLAALGNPEARLPPVLHIAGTNGKGSTCAFLRAMAEAQGLSVHVTTSPHLVRFNERIRIAGKLVTDAALEAVLEEVEAVNAGQPITVFEVLMAATFVLFARAPADLCILEVGLGGRFDATNVIAAPKLCAITALSMDHREFLGDTLAKIAFEKAGIMKRHVPVVTGFQPAEALEVLAEHADAVDAPLLRRGRDWGIERSDTGLRYRDGRGVLDLPPPSLLGPHQVENAGIAVAVLRASGLVGDAAIARGVATAEWPARMQRLAGPLARMLPADWELWLDGGHNPGGGVVLGEHLASWADRPVHLLVGMKQAKDTVEFLRPLLGRATTVWAVAEPGQHLALPIERIIAASAGVARPGPDVRGALAQLPRDGHPARVLICGSLYLAGEVLKLEGWEPS